MKQIHLLLGGMTGSALDRVPPTNTGMFALKRMLAPRLVTTWTWGNWDKVVDDIRHNYKSGNQVVLIGYSGGGSRGVFVARMLDAPPSIPVALVVAYDPSPAGQMVGLLANVAHACCYYNEKPMMWWPGVGRLGGGRLFAKEPVSPPVIDTITIAQQHLAVQFNGALHQRTIAMINAL